MAFACSVVGIPRTIVATLASAIVLVAALSVSTGESAAMSSPASKGGVALLVTAAAYDGNPLDSHAGCRSSVQAISDKLHREQYDIVDASDRSRSQIADAIAIFSEKLHAPTQSRTFVYVCGYAGDVRGRMFFLPALHATTGMIRLETDGILIKQLVDIVAETNGTFVADLDTIPDHSPLDADAVTHLRQGISPNLRLDVLLHGDRPIGAAGREFALGERGRDGTLEEARSVALLRQTMTVATSIQRTQGDPISSALGLRPDPGRSATPSAPIGGLAASPQPSPVAPVAVTAPVSLVTVAPAAALPGMRSRPHRKRILTSVVPVGVIKAAAVAPRSRKATHTAHVTPAGRALAVRRLIYRRQLALYRASQTPNILDMLIGADASAHPAKQRVAALTPRGSRR